MQTKITDKQQLDQFKQAISSWLKELTGGHGDEFISGLEITEAKEYGLRRVFYEAQLEERKVMPFTKQDNTPVSAPATVLDIKQVDPWPIRIDPITSFTNKTFTIEIPESVRSVSCKACGGTGKANCPACMGQKGVYCETCRGDGKVKCSTCKGSKNIKCDNCAGTGQMEGGTGVCPRCGGKGEYKCPACEGKGTNPCGTCGGKMRLPCKACSETGTVACPKCAGAGQSLSGFAVEINLSVEGRRQEVTDADVPGDILAKIPPNLLEWKQSLVCDGCKTEGDSLKNLALNQEMIELVSGIKKKIVIPQNAKLLFDRFTIEKASFWEITYKVYGTQSTLLIAGKGMKVVSGDNPLTNAYSGMLEDIKGKVSRGAFAEASDILKKIEHIGFIKNEAKGLRQRILSSRYKLCLRGGLIGAGLFSLIAVPAVYFASAKSFHAFIVTAAALLLNIAAGFIAGYSAYAAGLSPSGAFVKRNSAAGGAAIGILVLVYGLSALLGFNPARSLDNRQMLGEYNSYFPFGMRTLASLEDIKFLEQLIFKYTLTGVDLSKQQQDLEWLRNKYVQDKINMERAEKMRIELENAAKEKKTKKKIKYKSKKTTNILIRKGKR